MCQAATNVPGHVPTNAGTSSGMTTYEKIIETLTTLFPLWVCQNNTFITFPIYSSVPIKIWCHWQVIIGTLVGIYKPSAVSVTLHVLYFGNKNSNVIWLDPLSQNAGYMATNRPFHRWFGFSHAFNGTDTNIWGF